MNNTEHYQLWDEFLQEWPVSRVRNMTLEEYHHAGDSETFCYWLEARLEKLGSIWGGSAFKFGIYHRKNKSEKDSINPRYKYSGDYAWEAVLGNSIEEAFNNVKNSILKIIDAVQSNRLEEIDDIPLWPVTKWKIAYLYQDRDNMILVGVYRKKNLKAFLNIDKNKKVEMSELYRRIMKKREEQEDIIDFGRRIWRTTEEITQEHVLSALAEIDEKGVQSGEQSSTYDLIHDSKRYPPKLVYSLAHKYLNGEALDRSTFEGGEGTPCFKKLRDLGFVIVLKSKVASLTGEITMGNAYPKNLIYYGPPGTGKTYLTMEKAVEICIGEVPEDRPALVQRFKTLQEENRISFVTFHQSYSYEDFVEGIRPLLNSEDNEAGNQLNYECKEGVFKKICAMAKSSGITSHSFYDFDETKNSVWKMSLGNTLDPEDADVFDMCIENKWIALGYGQGLDYTGCNDRASVKEKLREIVPDIKDNDYNITSVDVFKNQIKEGDLIVVSSGNLNFRAIGKVTGEYQYKDKGGYNQLRSAEWLVVFDEPQPHEKIINNRFSQMTLYHLKQRVLKLDALKKMLTRQEKAEPENYVLIIDEINRGNIAKIFGELITLIEEDKRLGEENGFELTLTYSDKPFGVPNNLYIIGTMNTADRSIAILDTALRRRFEFVELMPDVTVIKGADGQGNIPDDEGEEIDLRQFLLSINQRITFLLNREMTIGHAYLAKVKTFTEFKHVLTQQIIPLLQEYFYEDWHRIQIVLRDIKEVNEKLEPQIIQHTELSELDVLGFDHPEFKNDIEFTITPESEITPAMIRKVYES